MMSRIPMIFIVSAFFSTIKAEHAENLDRRFIPTADAASTVGNLSLWHNPAGLAFMGGTESSASYLYEWSDLGNRHHGGANLAINFWQTLTFGAGLNTQAALNTKSRSGLGTELNGILGVGVNLSRYAGVGFSILRSHNFLKHQSSPWLMSFGFQSRPLPYLSVGGYYEEVQGGIFSAPNLVAGVAARPYKEYVTVGLDMKLVPEGKHWGKGFRVDPILSLKGNYLGYGAGISMEIPGIKQGWSKPIFALTLDFNFSHLGFGFRSYVNSGKNNYGLGAHVRASSEEWTSIVPASGLWVDLTIDSDGNLDEKPKSFTEKLFSADANPLSVLALLKRLQSDKAVAGIRLNFKGFKFGNASAEEWHDAIVSLRNAHKEVVVYLDAPSERDYFIAVAANKILMNKHASLTLRNFQATLVYLADTLDKIGVKADEVTAGSHKSAPRTFTKNHPSTEEIDVTSDILTSFYEDLIDKTMSARNIDEAALRSLFDRGEITADDAKDAKLVDELVTSTDEKTGLISGYENRAIKHEAWHPPKKIAVIPINDAMIDGRISPGVLSSFFPATGADDVVEEIEEQLADPDVVGIIIRIDSPGGDAMAGHKINQAIAAAKGFKPVVVSMSNVAASAGYLAAVSGSRIFALPNTITGSIGVFSLMFSGENLAKTMKINSYEVSPIKNPGPNMLRRITESERKETQRLVDWYYVNFIDTVSKGLNVDKALVEKNAEGKVFLGKQALENKLVHELGGFSASVDAIRLMTNRPHEELTVDIRAPGVDDNLSLMPKLFSLFKSSRRQNDLRPISEIARPYMKAIDAYNKQGLPQARLPFDINWRGIR